MALGDGTLNLISDMIGSARGNLNNYYNHLDDCIRRLNSNANYQLFTENTEIGRTMNEKLLQLRNIGNNTASDVTSLLSTTSAFVSEQRRLNQLEAQRRAQEQQG